MVNKTRTIILCAAAFMLTLGTAEDASAAGAIDAPAQKQGDAARRRQGARRKKIRQRHAVKYVCPMHEDIEAKEPGTCPKCLMELVRKDAKRAGK